MPHKDLEVRRRYRKEYAAKNRERAYELVKKWRSENPELWAQQRKRYEAKYPHKKQERTAKWQKRHPEQYAKISKESRNKNRGVVLANKAKYRAAKRMRVPAWLNKGQRFEMVCVYVYCNALRRIGLDYEVDHVVPLQGETVSGLHVPWNLQVIPRKENRAKSNGWA